MTAAQGAAELLARVHVSAGGWPGRRGTAWRPGAPGCWRTTRAWPRGCSTLSGVTGEARWLTLAGELLDIALARFGDGSGGFYDTADDGEALVYRPADPADGPTPSGAFAVAGALLSYSALTGSAPPPGGRGGRAGACSGRSRRGSRGPPGRAWRSAEALISGPAEIAVVGPADDARTAGLHVDGVARRPAGRGDRPGGRRRERTAGYRCSAGAAWSAGPRPPTSAAGSPASRRSPSRRRCAPRCRAVRLGGRTGSPGVNGTVIFPDRDSGDPALAWASARRGQVAGESGGPPSWYAGDAWV